MNDQIELPAVSMANTKKELLDAYEEAKKSFDGEKNVLVGKIEALEKMAASQAALIADLSQKSVILRASEFIARHPQYIDQVL